MLDDLHARGFGGLRVAGVDEVGRGPLAGPVVAAAVIVPASARDRLMAIAGDSKLLSPKKRLAVDALVRAECMVGIGEASVAEIDEINILQATFLAMRRALEQVQPEAVVVDGNQRIRGFNGSQACVVGGDRVELAIACASVVAKVYRDAMMVRLAEAHPHYGWASNAGYGSAAHLLALQTHGVTEHHRRSFAPVRLVLEAGQDHDVQESIPDAQAA